MISNGLKLLVYGGTTAEDDSRYCNEAVGTGGSSLTWKGRKSSLVLMAAELDLEGSVETQCVHDSHTVSTFCGLGNSSKRNYY